MNIARDFNTDDWADENRSYGYEVWRRNEQTNKWRLVVHTERKDQALDQVEEAGDFSIEQISYLDDQVESVTEIYRRVK